MMGASAETVRAAVARDREHHTPTTGAGFAALRTHLLGVRRRIRPLALAQLALETQPEAFGALPERARTEALTWVVSDWLHRAAPGPRHVIDGAMLLHFWERLSPEQRAAFPEHLDAAIRGLSQVPRVSLAGNGVAATAHALLTDGALRKALNGHGAPAAATSTGSTE